MKRLDVRAQQRLQPELSAWWTTVGRSRRPPTSPVWFLLAPGASLVYGRGGTTRVRNIVSNPRMGLNLGGDRWVGGSVILEGTVPFDRALAMSDRMPVYAAGCRERILGSGRARQSCPRDYPVPIRTTPLRARSR